MKKAKHSFIHTLSLYIVICVVVPSICITTLAAVLPYHELQEQRYIEHDHVMQQNGERVSEHLGYAYSLVTMLQDSASIRSGLKAAQSQQALTAQDIYATIGMPISFRNALSNHAISAVTIYSEGRLAYYYLQQSTTDLALSRCVTMLYNNMNDIPTGGCYRVPMPINGYAYYMYEYRNIYDGELLGQIVIEIEDIPVSVDRGDGFSTDLYDYQIDLTTYPGTQYFVYDTEGKILFSSNSDYTGSPLSGVLPANMLTETHLSISSEVSGHIVHSFPLYKPSLTATFLTPNTSIYSGFTHTAQYFLLWAIVISALLLLAAWSFRHRLTAPFAALDNYCRTSSEHPTSLPSFDPVFQEVETVQNALAARAAQIEEMQSVIMKNHVQMKDNEIQLLQSQINPHFLFNMLDIIGWQATQDQNANISEMVSHLGGLLRSNILLNAQEKISVEQEMQYVKDYLALEQIRLAGRFTYTINVDEDLLSCRIPKLSIQPIVENSIVHGFQNLSHPGTIEIQMWEDTDGLRCSIRDNGIGFDADGFFEHKPANQPDSKHNHIALHNIQDRIHMLCGPQYGIHIRSIIGMGTEVMITFPIDEGDSV